MSTADRALRYWPVVVALCIGLAASFSTHDAVTGYQARVQALDFTARAEQRAQILSYSLDNMVGDVEDLATYVQATHGLMSRADYAIMAEELTDRNMGLTALAWAPRVTHAERAGFEAKVRQEGFPNFAIQDLAPRAPAGPRDEYYPVEYSFPEADSAGVLGLDIASEAMRRRKLDQVRDSGKPSFIGGIRLVVGKERANGALVIAPVYRSTSARQTVEERRANFIGVVTAVFRVDNLIESVLSTATQPAGFDLYVLDPTLATKDQLIYFHSSRLRAQAATPLSEDALAKTQHWQGTIDVADRDWRLVVVSAFPPGPGTRWAAFATLAAGLTITGLAVLYLFMSLRRNGQLQALAGDLSETAARLERESADLVARDTILDAIMRCADELLRGREASVSMPMVLEHIARATGVSRAALFDFTRRRDGRILASMRYEWCAIGAMPQIGNRAFQDLDLEAAGLGDWLKSFAQEQAVAALTRELTPPLRTIFEAGSVRSVLLVPVMVEGITGGVISFSDCKIERQWSRLHIDTIETVATLIGSALARARTQKKLTYAGRIVENSPTLLFHIVAKPGLPLTYLSSNVDQYGYTTEELLQAPKRYFDLIHPEDRGALFARDRSRRGRADPNTRRECRIRRRDGTYASFEARVSAVRDARGRLLGFEGLLTDISERKTAEERIAALARTDALTGLPNRANFLDRLEQAFAAARRGARPFAVLFLDLDHFKDVNDSLGHPAGDALLRTAAFRIVGSLRETDLAARFGGDEFAILLSDMSDLAGAGALAVKIRAALAEPCTIEDNELHITASIGIATYAPDLSGPEEILAQSDRALYRAKEEGRDQYRFHSEDLDRVVRERISLAEDIRVGIERGEFELYYQPQVNVATGATVGMEALVRWRHPLRGLVNPDDFIPIAERTGTIVQLGHWVLQQACEQLAIWRSDGIGPPVMAINLSGVQIKRGKEFERDVASTLAKWNLKPGDIEFDVKEAVLAEISLGDANGLQRLRALGVSIAIDDFGAEYTAVSRLRAYDVKRIKIAPQFVAAMTRNPADATLVHAMISLAQQLGMDVIAEGVETEAQRSFLVAAADTAQAQGFYFSKPLSSAVATEFLRGKIVASPAAPAIVVDAA